MVLPLAMLLIRCGGWRLYGGVLLHAPCRDEAARVRAQDVPWQRPLGFAVGPCGAGGGRRVSHHTELISICFHPHRPSSHVSRARAFTARFQLSRITCTRYQRLVLACWRGGRHIKGRQGHLVPPCALARPTPCSLSSCTFMGGAGPLQCLVLDQLWWVYLLGPGHVCCAGTGMSSWHGCSQVGPLRVGCLDGHVHAPPCA